MSRFNTRELTLTGILTAIVIVMGLVPNFGFISINPYVGFTIIHIPILIGGYIGGRKVGGFLGLLFGVLSMYVAFTRPVSLLDPIFTNPLVSVLPRFLIGYFAIDLLNFYRKFSMKNVLTDSLFFATMTILHSILVITLLYIAGVNYWYFDVYGLSEVLTREGTLGTIDFISTFYFKGGTIFGFLLTIMVLNSLLEIVVGVLVGVPIVQRLHTIIKE
jgi:uncharacterized membrane protein